MSLQPTTVEIIDAILDTSCVPVRSANGGDLGRMSTADRVRWLVDQLAHRVAEVQAMTHSNSRLRAENENLRVDLATANGMVSRREAWVREAEAALDRVDRPSNGTIAARIEKLAAEGRTERAAASNLRQAIGLMSTAKPDMVMRSDDPIGMAREVVDLVQGAHALLSAYGIETGKPLADRISNLANRSLNERDRLLHNLVACGQLAESRTLEDPSTWPVLQGDVRPATKAVHKLLADYLKREAWFQDLNMRAWHALGRKPEHEGCGDLVELAIEKLLNLAIEASCHRDRSVDLNNENRRLQNEIDAAHNMLDKAGVPRTWPGDPSAGRTIVGRIHRMVAEYRELVARTKQGAIADAEVRETGRAAALWERAAPYLGAHHKGMAWPDIIKDLAEREKAAVAKLEAAQGWTLTTSRDLQRVAEALKVQP